MHMDDGRPLARGADIAYEATKYQATLCSPQVTDDNEHTGHGVGLEQLLSDQYDMWQHGVSVIADIFCSAAERGPTTSRWSDGHSPCTRTAMSKWRSHKRFGNTTTGVHSIGDPPGNNKSRRPNEQSTRTTRRHQRRQTNVAFTLTHRTTPRRRRDETKRIT